MKLPCWHFSKISCFLTNENNLFQVIFITEYMSSGSLKQFLKRTKRNVKKLPLQAWKRWCTQILSALRYENNGGFLFFFYYRITNVKWNTNVCVSAICIPVLLRLSTEISRVTQYLFNTMGLSKLAPVSKTKSRVNNGKEIVIPLCTAF